MSENSNLLLNKWTVLIVFQAIIVLTSSQCCIEFNINECIRCPSGMHLYRSNCIYDIEGCTDYLSGFDCLTCRSNYQLTNGKCIHERYSAAIMSDSNFVVYLESTLKPDPMLKIARQKLQNQKTMWINWYNYSLISNKTYLNKNSLIKNALKLMDLTVKATPQYIFTSSLEKANASLLFYRFTYEISLFGGFVDCLVLVETINGQDNYVQLNQAKFNLLSNQTGWMSVKTGSKDQVYILSKINSLFPQSNNESHIKGYKKISDGSVNFTMFFINYKEGVVPYIYIADPQELPTEDIQQNPLPVTNTTTTAPSKQQKPLPQDNPSKINNQSTQKQSPNSTNTLNNNANSNCSICNEITMNISNAQTNPIYAIGLSVITQQYQISSYSVQQVFYINTTPLTYGIYFNSTAIFYRLTFRIHQSSNQFEILNYTQSHIPFINTTRPINNNTPTKDDVGNKTDAITAGLKPNIAPNQTECNKVNMGNQFMDITNNQAKDLFLPRINLLLKAVYSNILQNSHISTVKFNLGLNSVSLNNITYQITYQNLQKKSYYFEVAIINNQFQIIKSPQITTSSAPSPSPTIGPSTVQPDTSPNTNSTKTEDKSNSTNANSNKQQATHNDQKQQPTQNVKTEPINHQNKSITTNKQQPSNQNYPKQQIKLNTTTPTNKPSDNYSANTVMNKTTQTPKKSNSTDIPPISNKTNSAFPIQIPQKNYTSQPRYKSLITILRSLYRIPSNATVASMREWQKIDGESRYQIVFNMSYKNQLPDRTIAKVSTYNLTINPSSFVSVKDQKIEYIKAESINKDDKDINITSVTSTSAKPLEISSSSSLQPIIPPLASYLRSLFALFVSHSPGLSEFKMTSLSSTQLNTTYGGSVKLYTQKVKFINKNQTICFEVLYNLISQGTYKENQEQLLNVLGYQAVYCQKIQQEEFKKVSFVNYTVLDRSINEQIIKINKNSPLTINVYQKWANFYQIRFTSLNYGKKEIVIDSSNTVTVLYKTIPQLLYSQQTKNTTLLQPKIAQILRLQMQKILKLSLGSLSLQFIKKTNDNKQVQLIDVYGKTKIKSMWSQPIYEYFKMSALYWPYESFTKIMSIQVFDLSYNQYNINIGNKNWIQLSTRQTFAENTFVSVISSLKEAYFGFLENSELIAIYRDKTGSNITLNKYITDPEGSRLYIAILKKFASFGYESAYLITVKYKYSQNTSVIENLQNLQLSQITNQNCQEQFKDNMNHLPRCKKCKENYRLVQNFCYAKIFGCLEYMNIYCMKCQNNLMSSQDMLQCRSQTNVSQKLEVEKTVNAYLWELNH